MKRSFVAYLLVFLLTVCQLSALADTQAEYSLPVKGNVALQSEADRAIAVQASEDARAAIPGESPVTGLHWEGDYLPMLVQISNAVGTQTVNGRAVKSSGIGKTAPWGLQYADIVYEESLYQYRSTRFIALYSDCFASGQPEGGVGPVRSCRIAPLMLREEWQAGLVFSGSYANTFNTAAPEVLAWFREAELTGLRVLQNTQANTYRDMRSRVQGKKAPDNLNVDLIAMRAAIDSAYQSTPRPFLFADAPAYGEAYASAPCVSLDWGDATAVSHFVYDAAQNAYLRYCGPGLKAAKWAPFTSFLSALASGESSAQQLAFANVIVQRVSYDYEDGKKLLPLLRAVGGGNADIFIGGRYIPGYWSRPAMGDPTVFYDDQGQELTLCRGKTFIALFPQDALCVVSNTAP